jgi:hypothetical protein
LRGVYVLERKVKEILFGLFFFGSLKLISFCVGITTYL